MVEKKGSKKKSAKKLTKEVQAAVDVVRAASRGELPTLEIPGYRGTPPLTEASQDNLIRAANILADRTTK